MIAGIVVPPGHRAAGRDRHRRRSEDPPGHPDRGRGRRRGGGAGARARAWRGRRGRGLGDGHAAPERRVVLVALIAVGGGAERHEGGGEGLAGVDVAGVELRRPARGADAVPVARLVDPGDDRPRCHGELRRLQAVGDPDGHRGRIHGRDRWTRCEHGHDGGQAEPETESPTGHAALVPAVVGIAGPPGFGSARARGWTGRKDAHGHPLSVIDPEAAGARKVSAPGVALVSRRSGGRRRTGPADRSAAPRVRPVRRCRGTARGSARPDPGGVG